MFEWLIANFATIIALLVIAVIVVLIVVKMYRDKKQGKHSCGGNCAGCTLCHHGGTPIDGASDKENANN